MGGGGGGVVGCLWTEVEKHAKEKTWPKELDLTVGQQLIYVNFVLKLRSIP